MYSHGMSLKLTPWKEKSSHLSFHEDGDDPLCWKWWLMIVVSQNTSHFTPTRRK